MSKSVSEAELRKIVDILRTMADRKLNETHTSDYHEVAILGEALGIERTIRVLEEALAIRGITV